MKWCSTSYIIRELQFKTIMRFYYTPTAAAAAAKSLQSCPTLCDPIDGRLPRPWDSLGKNTGVGCHFLLQCIKVKREREVTQSCLTLSDRMDYSLPGSSIHGILQARVLEWGAIALSDTSTRMIKIQNADKTTCCWGCGGMGTLAHCYREGKMVQTLFGEYNSFTMLCYLLLYNKVNQLHVYIRLLPFGPPSRPSIPPISGS